MKIFKIVTLAIIAGFLITACTIEQTVDFNKDMSGSMVFNLNMQDMLRELKILQPDSSKSNAQLMQSLQSTESLMALKKEFEQTEGISNFNAIEDYDNGQIGFSFNFENIENINKGIGAQNEKTNIKTEEEVKLFTVSKKKLTIDFGNDKESDEEENPMAGFDTGEYILTLNFPFPIKSVSNKLYTVSKDKKQVQLNIELTEMMKDFGKLRTDITW